MYKNPVRLLDLHTCPNESPKKHGIGKVLQAESQIRFLEQAIACEGHKIRCQDKTYTNILPGNACVRVNGKKIALVGDKTDHKGTLKKGAETIYIQEGEPFVEIGAHTEVGAETYFGFESEITETWYDQHFVLRHSTTKEVLPYLSYRIIDSQGRIYRGISDHQGKTCRIFNDFAEKIFLETLEFVEEAHESETCLF